ncbi:MAG: membrane biogenesis protein, partial [Gammaproteobacteria bacterium]
MQTELITKFPKPVLIVTGLISFYALLGFVILPSYMQTKLPELITSETGRKSTIESIEFNPFSLELSLINFSMQEVDSQEFVKFDEFYINVQVWESAKNAALVLAEVRL